MSKPLAIIPCCGLGSRMNMSYNTSKEMLPDVNEYNVPIIQYSIDLCNKYNISPFIITRKDKTDLISYLDEHLIEYIIIPDTPEWPYSILASEKYWAENNILVLPDTRFTPEHTLLDIKHSLELNKNIVFALHRVEDVSKWGEIKSFVYCEKPNRIQSSWAWGLIGLKNGQEKNYLQICVIEI